MEELAEKTVGRGRSGVVFGFGLGSEPRYSGARRFLYPSGRCGLDRSASLLTCDRNQREGQRYSCPAAVFHPSCGIRSRRLHIPIPRMYSFILRCVLLSLAGIKRLQWEEGSRRSPSPCSRQPLRREKTETRQKSTKYLATTKPRSSEKTKADCTHTYHTCIPMKQAEPTATYNLVHALDSPPSCGGALKSLHLHDSPTAFSGLLRPATGCASRTCTSWWPGCQLWRRSSARSSRTRTSGCGSRRSPTTSSRPFCCSRASRYGRGPPRAVG